MGRTVMHAHMVRVRDPNTGMAHCTGHVGAAGAVRGARHPAVHPSGRTTPHGMHGAVACHTVPGDMRAAGTGHVGAAGRMRHTSVVHPVRGRAVRGAGVMRMRNTTAHTTSC